MKESQIAGVLTPILAQFGLELEAVEVIPAGKRRLLRVVVDGDGPDGRGPLLDDIAAASRALSAELDTSDVVGAVRVHPGGVLARGQPPARTPTALAAQSRPAGRRHPGRRGRRDRSDRCLG